MERKKAQIWVETAIYTLIGLTVMAVLLAATTPQIEKIKDRNILRQTINALNLINSKIVETEQAPLNLRIVTTKLARGKIVINPATDTIEYILENTRLKLSEPGIEIEEAGIFILTEAVGRKYNIYLKRNYTGRIDITYDGADTADRSKTMQATAAPYKIYIENMGDNVWGERTHIDIRVE